MPLLHPLRRWSLYSQLVLLPYPLTAGRVIRQPIRKALVPLRPAMPPSRGLPQVETRLECLRRPWRHRWDQQGIEHAFGTVRGADVVSFSGGDIYVRCKFAYRRIAHPSGKPVITWRDISHDECSVRQGPHDRIIDADSDRPEVRIGLAIKDDSGFVVHDPCVANGLS
jgi:hypothetical protein